MRYAIWAAVSTEAQAEDDKVSLSEQEAQCRAVAGGRGWAETAGPFVVPGESRTRWVNLRDAEGEIPELHTMLNCAQRGEYDVLVLYDYNRLRDLLDPVAKTLSHYGVQIFSVSQPIEPIPADDYNPYASDTPMIMQGMSKIISQAQIADLRRKYNYAMPRRIAERGLPMHIPYGYRKPPGREHDSKAVPVQNHLAAVVVKLKDMLLSGMSLRQIALTMDKAGEPPPGGGKRWYTNTVGAILRNPFYAGYVRFGLTRNRIDPRTGKRTRTFQRAADKIITATGKHKPLWDDDTHREILGVLNSRGHRHPGKRGSRLSGLLACGVCGAKLWVNLDGQWGDGSRRARVYRCSNGGHVAIKASDAVARVSALLVKVAKQTDIQDDLPQVVLPDYRAQLSDLQGRRKRLEDAYLSGVWELADFTARASDLDQKIDDLRDKLSHQEQEQSEQRKRIEALGGLSAMADHLPEFIAGGNPREINNLLRGVIDRVVLEPGGGLRMVLK